MKKILLFLSAVAIFAACQDFLDIRPAGSTPTSGIDYTKSENIYQSISAAYASMRTWSTHAFSYICVFEIPSDNADKGSTPSDNPTAQALADFTFDASNSLINELWTGYFDIVSAANHAIHQMPLFVEAQQNAENQKYAMQCQGEAKAIRAYAYFNLTRMFGRVPIIDTTLTAEQLASKKQASTAELYDFMEKDLEEALDVLPESYTSDWAGRINRYTAMAIKAKIHLYQNEWDSVASLTDRIMASGRYGLLDDFREVFSIDGENSRESLFEIQCSTLGKSSGEAPYMEYAFVQGPLGNTPSNMQGWGFCTPSDDLIQFYQDRGEVVRPSVTLLYRGTKTPEGDSIKVSCMNPVYNGKVYTPSQYNKWSFNGYGFDHNIRIIRYSDVLLMFAEAKTHGATAGTQSGYSAQSAINEVRQRAGLEPLGAPTLQEIWDERRAELALEEDRFFDLIRTGQAAEVLGSRGYVDGKHNLLPIPDAQKQLNNNLEQNNNY